MQIVIRFEFGGQRSGPDITYCSTTVYIQRAFWHWNLYEPNDAPGLGCRPARILTGGIEVVSLYYVLL